MAFDAAEDDGEAVALRKAVEFFIEQPADGVGVVSSDGFGAGDFLFTALSFLGLAESVAGGSAGDTVEPGGEGVGAGEFVSLLGQGKEDCLGGVFSVLLLMQHASTDAQHHRPMPTEDFDEGSFIMLGGELVEQLAIVMESGQGVRGFE